MTRVLVVDDDATIRRVLFTALSMEGYEVETLPDGSCVIDTLARSIERVVVLMDLMMPRVDGWEVCRRFANEADLAERHVIVVMSAAARSGEPAPAGAYITLQKPFNLDRVFRIVASLSSQTAGTSAIEQIANKKLLAPSESPSAI